MYYLDNEDKEWVASTHRNLRKFIDYLNQYAISATVEIIGDGLYRINNRTYRDFNADPLIDAMLVAKFSLKRLNK